MNYISKPCKIQALQFTNGNANEIIRFINKPQTSHDRSKKVIIFHNTTDCDDTFYQYITEGDYVIKTPAGEIGTLSPHDFVDRYKPYDSKFKKILYTSSIILMAAVLIIAA